MTAPTVRIDDRADLARTDAHATVLDALAAGIAAAHPERVLADALSVSGDQLRVEDAVYDLAAYDEILVIGGGNAAAGVAAALESLLGERVDGVVVTDDPRTAIEESSSWPLGVVAEKEREDRYLGYEPSVIDDLGDVADAVLVKADGARMRQFKAPGSDEPRLPSQADTVLPIASARVVGQPLTDAHVHRPGRVSEITGRSRGEKITAGDVATVLASPAGGHKSAPDDATVVPVVNMVDNDELDETGREIAAAIHEQADVPHVALTQMTAVDPLVAVV